MNTRERIEQKKTLVSVGSLILVLIIWGLLKHYNVSLHGLIFFPKVR